MEIPKKTASRLLSSLLFLALAQTALASNEWYVNGVNGNDNSGCTSPQTACKTVGHAISLASPGDAVMVAAAIYQENLTIGFSLSLIGSGANTTIIDGGGVNRVINISSGSVTLSGLTIRNGVVISGNRYFAFGGGILNRGNLLVIASAISGNSARGCGGPYPVCPAGGGIYNAAKLTIENSTVAGNTVRAANFEHGASAAGGGIFNHGTLIMINSTLVNNSAEHFGAGYASGGGIANLGTATINNSTISGNSISGNPSYTLSGGGIAVNQGYTVTLQNSIVSNNSGSNCSGTTTSNGYNLSSDGTCNFSGPGDINNANPNLGPLQYNGGTTQTMALLSGSPAIDMGNPSGCRDSEGNLLRTDQRGMPRPDKEDTGGCDMGAYERQSD